MMRLPKLLMVAAALVSVGCARAGIISFDFNSQPPLTSTPLTLSSGGLDATITSSADPGGFFVISPLGFLSLSENVLVSPGAGPELLDITFSQSLSSFSADFGTEGNGSLTLTALSGGSSGTTVGSSSATGTPGSDPSCAPDCFPQGTISFSGPTFDSLILSDASDPGFALGSFTVSTAPNSVPEPSTLALFGAGLAALAFTRGRRRRRA